MSEKVARRLRALNISNLDRLGRHVWLRGRPIPRFEARLVESCLRQRGDFASLGGSPTSPPLRPAGSAACLRHHSLRGDFRNLLPARYRHRHAIVLFVGRPSSPCTSALSASFSHRPLSLWRAAHHHVGILGAERYWAAVRGNADRKLHRHCRCDCGILFMIIFYALREAARAEALAQREHERSESLLVNMLPTSIAARLKVNPGSIADSFSEATIYSSTLSASRSCRKQCRRKPW